MSGDPTSTTLGPMVSTVLGDRVCSGCGFNLHGRPIEREPIYELLAVRCPQCGTVTAMDEYPPLGRWAPRWGMLTAGLWLLFVMVFSIGLMMVITITSIATVAESTDQLERQIRSDYRDWLRTNHPADDTWFENPYFIEYWETQGRAILAEPGVLMASIEFGELVIAIMPIAASFAAGCVWSVMFLARRRRGLVITAVCFGLAIALLLGGIWLFLATLEYASSEHVAWVELRLPMLMIMFLTMFAFVALGVTVGRSIVRGVIRATLPPRMRGALSLLWTADGHPVPGLPGKRS